MAAGMQAYRQQAPRTPASASVSVSAAGQQRQHPSHRFRQDTAACAAATTAVPPPPSGPTLHRQALDLRRLLHAMRTSTSTSTSTSAQPQPPEQPEQLLPSHVLADRLALCHSLLAQLHRSIAHARQSRVEELDRLAAAADGEEATERRRREHLDRCAGEDGLARSLTAEVEEVGRLAGEDLAAARRRERMEEEGARDIVDELFLSPQEEVVEEDEDAHTSMGNNTGEARRSGGVGDDVADDYSLGLGGDEDNGGTYHHHHQQQQPSPSQPTQGRQSSRQQHHPRYPTGSDRTTEGQNEELQRQQAGMLESEIAEMAAQMKSATLRMNTTLREQSSALDGMERTVTENLDRVTDVTAKVTDHVSRGWRKAAATWTLLFSVVGTFAFLFMTMRVAPKRRDACIFSCYDSRHRRYLAEERGSEYEDKWNRAEDERKRLMEELRLRDESDAAAAAAAAAAAGRREGFGDQHVGEADEARDEDDAVCETQADGTLQCFGGQSSSSEAKKNQAEEAEKARVEKERIAAELKADQERNLEEERLRRKEAAEAQALADKIKGEEKQKKAEPERRERDHIASEKTARQEEPPNKSVSEQDFRFAAANGRLDVVVLFIDRHPDKVNSPDANRWTALHEAARAGHTDIIKQLLEAGADATLTTNLGKIALQLLEAKHGSRHPAASILRQEKLILDQEETESVARSEL